MLGQWPGMGRGQRGFTPAVDMYEDKENVIVEAQLSGFLPDRPAQEAVDAVLLEAVPRATFEAEAMACTELQADIRHELVRSIEAHAALLVLLAQTTAVERVRLFLKRFAARRPSADFVSLPMGRRDIADHLGLSMETVSRAFSSLRARGDIAMKNANFFRLERRGSAEGGFADAA